MTESTTEVAVATKDVIAGKINVELTKASLSIQALSDMEAKLVYNEDNLPQIKEYLNTADKVRKAIDAAHKEGKAPVWAECVAWDESKRGMYALIGDATAKSKYDTMCRDIEARKKKADDDKRKKEEIQGWISTNLISFAIRISDCKTNDELLSVERMINLEKANKNKYGEHIAEATEKYSSLTDLVKQQKDKVKEFEKLELDRIAAEISGNDAALIEVKEKQEVLTASIDEAKVVIQETAINQSVSTPNAEVAREVFASVKPRRTTWEWEVVDLQKTAKSNPAWVKMETVDEKIDEFLKSSKDMWNDEKVNDKIVNGIRFFKKITY